MNYQEFQARTYEDCPYEVYTKIFEPMYAAGNLDKDEFCRIIKPAVKPYAAAAKKEREDARFCLALVKWGRISRYPIYQICIYRGFDQEANLPVLAATGKYTIHWRGGEIFNDNEVKLSDDGFVKMSKTEEERYSGVRLYDTYYDAAHADLSQSTF